MSEDSYKARRWWSDGEDKQRHVAVMAATDRLLTAQVPWRETLRRFERMYGNEPIGYLSPSGYAANGVQTGGAPLSLNVCQAVADTYTARVSEVRPKVSFVTSGATWALQQQAKALDAFDEGQNYEAGIYDEAALVVGDSAVTGTGVLHLYAEGEGENETIAAERVMLHEMLMDPTDAYYGRPRSMFRVKYVDRGVLVDEFPEHAEILKNCDPDHDDSRMTVYGGGSDDMIRVVQAWHLPSSRGKKNGRFSVCVRNRTLSDDVYERDYFPFIPLRRAKPRFGWYGRGIVREIMGLQREINHLLLRIAAAHNLLGSGHWFIENGSDVKFVPNNAIGSEVRYTGVKPTLETATLVSPEIYQQLWALYTKSFEMPGVSQLEGQSQKPAGLDSGKALRTYATLGAKRHKVAMDLYHGFYLEIAKQRIDLAKEIAERNPKFGVRATSRNMMRPIEWKKVAPKENEYVLKMYPTNSFADDPEARMQQVQEFSTWAGWKPERAMRLLNMPDLEADQNFDDSSYDMMMETIDAFTRGEYLSPEPFEDLAEGITLVQKAYNFFRRKKLPESNLELFRRWMGDAKAILAEQAPPAPPQLPAAPGMGAPPAAAPPPAVAGAQ